MPRLTAGQLTALKNDLAANTNTVNIGGTNFAINSNDVLLSNHTGAASEEAAQKVAAFYNGAAAGPYLGWNPAADKAKADALVDLSVFTPADSIPGYKFTVTSANATVGATYTNSTITFTVLATIAAQTTLLCSSASGNPGASGTLTKTAGTGDATITFSAAVVADPANCFFNRAQVLMLKRDNAIKLTQGTGTLDARQAGVRKNFQDCMRNNPSGAGGAIQDAGWGAPATPGAIRTAMQKNMLIGEKLLGVAGSGSGNTGGDARGSATNPDVASDDANGAAIVTLTAQDIKDAWILG